MKPIHALLAVCLLLPASLVQAEKPNILFIFADDQCFETIRAYGHTDIDTPHLDKLAQRGTSFTHAYNMGSWSGAVCIASRMMINTGKFVWKAGKDHSKTKPLYQDQNRMWSQLMNAAGYESYFTGKWHVKADPAKIFTVARNVRGGMPNQTPQGYNRPIDGKPDPWSPYDPKFEGFWKGGKHWSEVVGDDGVDFLNMAAKSDKPFFMYLAFNAPHDPRQAPKAFVDRYPLDRIKMPVNWLPEYPYKDKIDCSARLRDEKLAPFPRTENAIKVNRQEYYAIITHMDEQIGRILDALEQTGKADNTWIFFTADHGLGVGHHGLMGKQNLFDHSVRVPFIVVGPKVASNARVDAPIYLQDVMPTTLELAGAEKPDYVQFNSLLPVLRGQKKHIYDAIYGGYLKSQRMVAQDGFKLLLYPKVPKILLFDLKKDPHEMTDLAGNPEQKARMKKLFARLLALQEETGDTLDLKSTFPELL